jgi:putative SOS response-associated peptidase YedK
MCGRIRLDTDWSEIVRVFDLDPDDIADFNRRWNLAPSQRAPLITGPRGARRATWGVWGFVPFWERSAKPKTRPINAKAETVAESGMFKLAFRERRCVVPATGFYEWRTLPDGKQPYLFARPDGGLIALAGIWSRWRPEGGAPVDTFCVLTTTPNAVAGQVHDRMPVVLPDRRALDLWLDPDVDVSMLPTVLRPAPDDLLGIWPISRAINSPAADSAAAAARLDIDPFGAGAGERA